MSQRSRLRDARRALVLLLLAPALAPQLRAQQADPPSAVRDWDGRRHPTGDQARGLAPSARRSLARFQGLRTEPASVSIDPVFGTIRGLAGRTQPLRGPVGGEAQDLAWSFVHENLALLGLNPDDFEAVEVVDVVRSRVSGTVHLYAQQRLQGLEVLGTRLSVNVDAEGRILGVGNTLVPNLVGSVGASTPSIDARQAVISAADHLGAEVASLSPSTSGSTAVFQVAAISSEPIAPRLAWLPIRRGLVRLVWTLVVRRGDVPYWYDITVDAENGKVWTRFDRYDHASYRVFEQPAESPNHAASPPPADGRTVVADPEDPTASPDGWHDDGTPRTILRGNNVHAFIDPDGNGSPPATEPDCGPGLVCDFDAPIDFAVDAPPSYSDAASANLFYWVNLVHDVQYQYGFDEAAGNFQVDNFGLGGVGGDDVIARAQVGGNPCPNNAFFGVGPDGQRGDMIMCLWVNSTPNRDFSLDNAIVVHEVGHGISGRLIGGPSTVSCLDNAQQPGEGLSDWWGLVYTHRPGDTGADPRGLGTYILSQPQDGSGIRPQRYSTDPAINTYTYASIGNMIPSDVHGIGSVWTQAAWEVYWALVDHWDFDPDLYDAQGTAGNQRMMLYVQEGLQNTTCNPTFLDVRDGILQAAMTNHGGEDVCRLWAAFAAFGLGEDASTAGPDATTATDGFAIPAACQVVDVFADGFASGDTSAWSLSVP